MLQKYLLPDEIFQLQADYQRDSRPDKINGGIGIYLTEKGKPYVLPVVKKAIAGLSYDNFSYLPIRGDAGFLSATARLVFGHKLYQKNKNYLACQGVNGGTNGVFIWDSLMKMNNPKPTVLIGRPTWINHLKAFDYLGYKAISYNHLTENKCFNLHAFRRCLAKHPDAYVLFHGGMTHNPSGINPTKKQWEIISRELAKNKTKVIIDLAYMGLGKNITEDCLAARLFMSAGIDCSIVVSFSKNMSLYQHRTGALFVFCSSRTKKIKTEAQLQYLFRINNSNPAAFGELIVREILTNKRLKKEWVLTMQKMVASLKKRRKLFAVKSGQRFQSVINEHGLFSLLNIDKNTIQKLKKRQSIYLLSNGRINFGGLSIDEVKSLAQILAGSNLCN